MPETLLRLKSIPPPEGSVEQMYGLMLYGAMRTHRPQVVVELGTGRGYSTAWIMLGLAENESGELYTCDLNPSDNPVWNQVGLTPHSLTYFSNDPVSSLTDKLPAEIDFIFHDAGHSWDEVAHDLMWLLPRLRVGGALVIHDIRHSPQMGEKLVEWFDSRPDEFKYETVEEASGVGIATRLKTMEGPKQCVDESSGSTTRRDLGSLPGRTGRTTSRTTPRSSRRAAGGRSKKTKTSSSKRPRKRKVRGRV